MRSRHDFGNSSMTPAGSFPAWWQKGVIYQIYPRSFQDSNSDGIGDLNGILSRLDYLVELGIDAVWLSPIFPSPMADFGYDIADYCDVDPIFGTLDDFDRLLAALHSAGLKLILDFVPNHTSDRHPWFLESRSSRTNAKRHWYIWRDPRPDGAPPNNWISEFGGPAWTLDETSGQYYYHAYLSEQPDLNWRNPEVRAAMLDVLRFWLARGVDGFRVDAIHHLVEDEQLRDNPLNPEWREDMSPARRLIRLRTMDQPEVHQAIAAMRQVADEYGGRLMIGEAYLPIDRLMAYYGVNLTGFHLPFNFHLISAPWKPAAIADLIETYERALPTWDSSLVAGEEIFIGGSTANATQGDQYLQVASITNGTPTTNGVITFGAGTTVTAETGKTVTLSPALRDVRIDPGVIIDTTNAPAAITSSDPHNPIYTPTGAPADPASFITIDSANSINIAATATLKTQAAININAAYVPGVGYFDTNVTLNLFGSYTAQKFDVRTGSGDDDIEFKPAVLTAATTINSGAGDDLIHVFGMPNVMNVPTTAADSQILATVSLDGQDGADEYLVDATAHSNYIININDSGALDSGNNTLMINGAATTAGQTFLIRDLFVAIVQSEGSPSYQRINYNNTITDRLIINGGDVDISNHNPNAHGDHFYLDGNSAVMTLNAGNGVDTFQIGQVYASAAINGPVPGSSGLGLAGAQVVDGVYVDGLHTTLTTVGYLSDGVDEATTIYGGSGADTFQVYSNKADLSLIGGSGDDTFIVRAFLVAAGTHIGVQGGSGNDIIQYNINAPVDIQGGTGFNTLVLLGTEAADTFVVTDHGIFGGGLNVSFTNIQAVTIDTLEGNDTIYVRSTPQDVVTTINAGTGGDTIDVGGNVTGAVISANTKGASSVTDNTVDSNDSRYNTLFVDGISVAAGGSSQIIGQDPRTVVHENDPTSIAQFTVSAPPGLSAGQTAYVNVSPTTASAEWTSKGAKGLEVSTDGIHWAANLALAFTNTTAFQTVYLRAVAGNTYPLNETITIASTIVAIGGVNPATSNADFNALILPTVKVFLETSTTGLIIDQGIASTTITGGTSANERMTYSYQLSLNKQPAPGEKVTVALHASVPSGDPSPGLVFTDGQGNVLPQHNGQPFLTFTASNYNQPQTIK